MKFENNDLIVIWHALLMNQQDYTKDSKEWLRREDLITRLEEHLNITRMLTKIGVDEMKGQPKDD